ncbi:VWA domain-containing protein [Mycolicibacterium sp. 120270]|uniref:vWA domain-containing protein n=1 Tax=Mycolicibacterium sp. 120270 TaxID=3090600 RepID=UPI00299F408A|nr:VWA domain-containing protein [Mycolicibacterium sp. 120270]MDX1885475.1 VWA domain-containing protein [Mycolicibacterium sp. 120270]
MTTPYVLRGVDVSAFAVALVAKLRGGGVVVSADGPATLVQAMRSLAPRSRSALYWAARLSLVNRLEDLAAFDSIFDEVFADLPARRLMQPEDRGLEPSATAAPAVAASDDGTTDGEGLPWTTMPTSMRADTHAEDGVAVPELLPSRLFARADESFDRFDEDDLQRIGVWLEQLSARWPRRRSMRREVHRHGKRIDVRASMRSARETGWEVLRLRHTRPRYRPRRVVLVCDVSGSMRPYATIYLHLMRAAALRQKGVRPEVFAFSTSLTRLTPTLSHRSAEVALAKANAKVVDRYGGTHLGRSVGRLLAAPHGSTLRGALVIIASDGWDSDPPEVLERALARVRRRAAMVVWLNPRAAQPGFQPLAGSMAAALPYCDMFLPAHSLAGLRDLVEKLSRASTRQ